ncbi:MAG: FAD-dependent oxidoreductase [Chloroflexi bacterium]|nr:FAD-dependent oxidoreductase [Chloroflexota bacterium]
MSQNDKLGAVLVVGGGIGGIQAALDLAESGYRVHLVEKSAAVGGVMAQLDKTFPTLDCAMCILSPKLIECGRHPNIELLSCSELLEVDGEPGHFNAKVIRHPRYVDLTKCTGCADCAQVCPVDMPSEFEQGLAQRKAIFRPFAQAFPNAFAIEKRGRALCGLTCPAGTNVQGYVALIAKKDYEAALALIRERIPMPGVLGRICPAPCEEKCNRRLVEQPVAIRALKRFAADMAKDEFPLPEIEQKEQRVAIIGSGPAGLSCACELRRAGYQVTIFEALPVAGGMLYVGIPEYRLPKNVLEREIGQLRRLGIEIRTGTPIGKELTIEDLFQQGYQAVFVGVGAHRSQRLRVPGEDAQGVIHGVDFLRAISLGKEVKARGKVAIIGGGDVAIDSARSALRLGGSEVTILYRRTRVEMPAREEEIEAAEEEGVKIEYLVAPTQILSKNGKVSKIRCTRMELGEPDSTGRRRPVPIPGSEFDFEADVVIPAIGQAPDLSFLENSRVNSSARGTIEVDPLTMETSREGVFAGGDCQTGPSIAVEALAAGARAAESIIRYLDHQDLREGRAVERQPSDVDFVPFGRIREPRGIMPTVPVEERIKGFEEIELGFLEDAAIREASRCLNCGICCECMQCVQACKANAINHNMKEEIVELLVGSVVLCPGFDEFDPTPLFNYGYRKHPNVVTSIEFERMLSASGPYQGELLRPSDRKPPQRIAWIQCVGSRDESLDRGYCSSVCCTYAVKEAIIAKEHVPLELEQTIFYMDMRTQGKDFDRFYERGEKEGIEFIRAKAYSIEEVDGTGSLHIKYAGEDGRSGVREFDLVVLSVGLQSSPATVELAKRLGVQLNRYGFCNTVPFSGVETSKPGIFVAGAFSGPKDIPETVVQASAAAGSASTLLATARSTLTRVKEYPPEKDITGQEPRIGVFVCHCGINIGGVVNVPEVTKYAETLPNVAYAEDNLYTCSQDTQERIKAMIEEHKLNRVIVASCTPRTHEPLFQETLREAGLNKYLFEMANIRDQCSWVHMREPERATDKAKDLVRMTVAKARLKEPLQPLLVPVNHAALVIGGGVAGLASALNLADQGFEVHLIERDSNLGGMARRIHHTLDSGDVQEFLAHLIKRVSDHPKVRVYTNTWIVDAHGFVGNFTTEIMRYRGRVIEKIDHGVTIIATGAQQYEPEEYLYGRDPRVLTQLELGEEIARGNPDIVACDNLVMIQCVGSRDGARPYCSRVCCNQAINNALKLKQANPNMNIYVLYRDMRTYGFYEQYYQEARQKGVVFLRYDSEDKPEVSQIRRDGRYLIRVEGKDPVLGERVAVDADILALSVAMLPSPEVRELAMLYKVPVNADGFFLEAHVKLRPVDFATEGVFVCGLAHAPKSIEESITQAKAAVSRATTILAKETVTTEGIVCSVNENICSGCGICEVLCPYGAIAIDEDKKVAKVNQALCKGCGTCCAACPSGAAQQRGFTSDQISSMVEALLVT